MIAGANVPQAGTLPLNPPQRIIELNINGGVTKANMPWQKLLLLGCLAGLFIACGASASSVAMHNIANVGLQRLIGGCIFPVGLMMIVFIGGELFTGDCLMVMGALHKKYSPMQVIRVLILVWLSNLVGSLLMAWLVTASGQLDYTGGMLGAFTIKIAMGKVGIDFGTAIISGILCNIFVCAAVLMAAAATDIAGKVWAIFFPIMAFVVSGYEHCVANMYYIPAGIFAMSNPDYVEKAQELYGYTDAQLSALNWGNFFLVNELPVTIGNVIGGMIVMGVVLYLVHGKSLKDESRK